MAVVLDKEIIPVKLEAINPYGFVNKYHALQLKPMKSQYPHHDVDNLKEVAIAICKISLSYEEKRVNIYKSEDLDSPRSVPARIFIIQLLFFRLLVNVMILLRKSLKRLRRQ